MNIQDPRALIAESWDVNKNSPLKAEEVTYGSHKVVHWVCTAGHNWTDSVKQFVRKQGRCPYCTNTRVLPGFNDLATTHPHLAKQWHPTKNGKILPESLSKGTERKVWWLCNQGHEWEARVDSRVTGNSCPVCSNKKVLPGFNDLATTHPHLAKQWHPTKNGNLSPNMVSKGSEKNVWWLGGCSHEWKAIISNRTSSNNNCPYCSGRRVQKGDNDLATRNPQAASFWHPTKNHLTPDSIPEHARVRVWWQCSKGHEWEAMVYAFVISGFNCPICINRKVEAGYNDLATTHPGVASQWHPTKNSYRVNEVIAGSLKTVWWKCEKGHEEQQKVFSRRDAGCTICNARGVSIAEEELAQWLESKHGLSLSRNIRRIIPPFELDIYIPERNIAVEFNGLYWHTESQGKDKWYHHKKWSACKDTGVQLIQIWEDDWNRNPDLAKRMLTHKLGFSLKGPSARKTRFRSLTQSEADTFLVENHIQGTLGTSLRFGLEHEETIVAAMLLKPEPGSNGKTLNLLRFASSQQVAGGFTKLLTSVLRTNPSVTSIVTFSDNTVSDGGLYEKNGFVAVKQLPPDYMYVVGKQRVHKFNYRLSRFKKDPTLIYKEGLSERELADLNGLDRVWDAGKTKWELTV